MPCIFCVAVLVLIAGALTSDHLDEIEGKLKSKAEGKDVRRTVDSESVVKYELTVRVGGRSAPVAVTIFKDHKRVRIQVLTHELTRQEVEQLEDELAEALDATIVDRSDENQEASARHAAEHDAAEKTEAEKVPAERTDPQSAPAQERPQR